MRRSIWLLLLGTPLVLFVTGGFAQSPKKPGIRAPQAINLAPFRSADGRITGWKVKIPGARPLASPAIAEGKVFVGGGFGSHEFYAFDASTGR
jgi:hypothetical protein